MSVITFSQRKSVRFAGLGGLLLLAFQNCSPTHFVANDGTPTATLSSISNTGGTNGSTLSPVIENVVNGTEMLPIEFKLETEGVVRSASGVPKGAIYDSVTKTLRWLPARGQAGQYRISFVVAKADTTQTINIQLYLNPIGDQTLQGGPIDFYQDGDIGYVFVHGMGDVDRCADRADLAAYWGAAPQVISPQAELALLACYNARDAAEFDAVTVAQQILAANCGRFNKCVVITHSMGGLVMEHIMTHTREPQFGDPEPALYQQRALYQQVKDRVISVISIASAAGGSKVSSIVQKPGNHEVIQAIIGQISRWIGDNSDSTRSVAVARASHILAPMNEDPGVPFFMVPGYTVATVREKTGIFGGLFDQIFDTVPMEVYDGDASLATLDTVVEFNSRSDGLVDFRSACGILSDDEYSGPGSNVALPSHLKYCFESRKKANHFVWFMTNMNHFLISTPWSQCNNSSNPCSTSVPTDSAGTFVVDSKYHAKSSIEVMRLKLHENRLRLKSQVLALRTD